MPGIVVFRRRWSVGSDDLVVPGVFLCTLHFIWVVVLAVILSVVYFDTSTECVLLLWRHMLGYLVILIVSVSVELAICIVALRGSILDTGPRASMQYILYLRMAVMLVEIAWLVLGVLWLYHYFTECTIDTAKQVMLGIVISNWLVILSMFITIWCTFDTAGRSWVKMKQYQRSRREAESRFQYRRSGSNRNWRQRKVIRAYQDSWDQRCRLLFCCMPRSDRTTNSFGDIARLLSDFFRDLDVVPSDVVAGLVLLRKFQKLERLAVVRQRKNDTYDFLSGVPVTPRTQFLALNDPDDFVQFQEVIHFMHFAHGAYGWPMFLLTHSSTGICQLCASLRCGCFTCCGQKDAAQIVDDNCCQCNYGALRRMLAVGEVEVIYATYHVDIGETPFFVAVDYTKRKVVVSIRGTLSMKDVITDLNAEGEPLPVDPPREDWLGHKGMVQAAQYILDKLNEENLVSRALNHNPGRGTTSFDLVIVGHSLGAGTAAILAILMKSKFPALRCYSYSPPGGLLSLPAVEFSKSFIISVVVGKDVVPRIGLHQMEALRADLINAIKRSVDPKWKTIACSVLCCGCAHEPTSVQEMKTEDSNINAYQQAKDSARSTSAHPNDASIALTLHNPLYPPGKIIHVVRHHPTKGEQKYESKWRQLVYKSEPVYQAVWAENTEFDEVLISPVMIQDHMPDQVLHALEKVITTYGPRKPQRQISNNNSSVTSAEHLELAGLPYPNMCQQDFNSLQLDNNGFNQLTTCALLHSPDNNFNIPSHHSDNTTLVSPSGNSVLSGITLRPGSPHSITPPHRLCLETSFTSLQSPTELPVAGSSKTSSMTGSIYSRYNKAQSPVPLNGLNYEFASLLDESILNRSYCHSNQESERKTQPSGGELRQKYENDSKISKNVAFDMSIDANKHRNRKQMYQYQKGILHRPQRKSLDLSERFKHKIDLIYDDWFGLAPLASPESMSEVSSISSRTSLATSIERCLQTMAEYKFVNDNNCEILNTSYELHTPKVMRRTPKISGNLSTCADDMKNVMNFKKLSQNYNFIRCHSHNDSSNSSDLSFESATSLDRNRCCKDDGGRLIIRQIETIKSTNNNQSKSADNIDRRDEGESINTSDPYILSDCFSQCPNCPCRRHPKTECCPNYDHVECARPAAGCSTNASSSDTFLSTESSLTTLEITTVNPSSRQLSTIPFELQQMSSELSKMTRNLYEGDIIPVLGNKSNRLRSVDRTSDSESDRKSPFADENDRLLSEKCDLSIPSPKFQKDKKIFSLMKKRKSFDDKIFSKNESLPLLSNLAEKSSPTNFVKRKKYVYPITTIARGESSV